MPELEDIETVFVDVVAVWVLIPPAILYPVIGLPPLLVGAVQLRRTSLLVPTRHAVTEFGLPGLVDGVIEVMLHGPGV